MLSGLYKDFSSCLPTNSLFPCLVVSLCLSVCLSVSLFQNCESEWLNIELPMAYVS